MAGEDEKATEEKTATKEGGGSKRLVMIGGAVALLALAGGAAYFLGVFGGGGEAEASKSRLEERRDAADQKNEAAAVGDTGGGAVVSLDTFVVNLADAKADRYLKTTMQFEFFTPMAPERFSSRRAQIRDLILTLLSSKTVAAVRTIEGKQQLRDELIARVNRVLGDDLVQAVYFAEFIVQ